MATKSKVAQTETTKPVNGSREHFEAYQAEQAAIAEAEATGSPEVVALRELAHLAERIFEGEGRGVDMTRDELLGEALLCAREDIDLLSDGAASGCGIDGMHFVRARNRIDLALKLADYREQFGSKAVPS